jgi:hypothetical protein
MHPTRLIPALLLTAALALPASGRADVGTPHETPIVVRVDDRRFGWTDAAVGAVAGVGATLVTAGGVALIRLRRPAPSHERGRRE